MLRVHLCCGPKNIRKDWINVDAVDFGQEVVADLGNAWTFLEDGSVDYIFCKDGLEHQASIEHFLGESARLLKPGGILEVWVPHFKNPSAYRVTHKHWMSWSYFSVYPEPHDAVKSLKPVSVRLIIGRRDASLWKLVHHVINWFPAWWERFLYVSNIHARFEKQ